MPMPMQEIARVTMERTAEVNEVNAHGEVVGRLLDTKGLRCPEPLMLLRGQMRNMVEGERIRVIATDPSTLRDFSDYCRFLGHELLHHSQDGDVFEYLLEKGRS